MRSKADQTLRSAGREKGVGSTVNLILHPFARLARFERWLLGAVWLVIAAKCIVVAWAFPLYHVPINAHDFIGPALVVATLVTVLLTASHE